MRLGEERIVRGREHLDEAPCLRPVDGRGNTHDVGVVHRNELGVTAAGEERHHALTGLDILAGALETRDVDGRPGRRRIAAGALHDVCAVHAGCPHADHELTIAGNGIRPLLDLESPFNDDSRAHSGMLRP